MRRLPLSAAVLLFGIHRMTHAQFIAYTRTILADGEFDTANTSRAYWAAVKNAVAKGKAHEIPDQTMQTYKKLCKYPWFR